MHARTIFMIALLAVHCDRTSIRRACHKRARTWSMAKP